MGFITDAADGELHIGAGIDGVAAGTQFQDSDADSAWFKIISDATNPRHEFYADGNLIATISKDRLSMAASSDGVQFANSSPSTDVNTLDAYEEGTFTPTLQDASNSDSEGQTYVTQSGTYTKIGNRVFFELELDVNSAGTLTGGNQATIANLPYAATSGVNFGACVVSASGLSITAGQSVSADMLGGDDYLTLRLWDATGGQTPLSITEFNAGSVIISGHYSTAS